MKILQYQCLKFLRTHSVKQENILLTFDCNIHVAFSVEMLKTNCRKYLSQERITKSQYNAFRHWYIFNCKCNQTVTYRPRQIPCVYDMKLNDSLVYSYSCTIFEIKQIVKPYIFYDLDYIRFILRSLKKRIKQQ